MVHVPPGNDAVSGTYTPLIVPVYVNVAPMPAVYLPFMIAIDASFVEQFIFPLSVACPVGFDVPVRVPLIAPVAVIVNATRATNSDVEFPVV
jgi:hypothetical protein